MESSMSGSEFSMNSTASSLIYVLQRVAKIGPDALKQLGMEVQDQGRKLRPEKVSLAVREAHQIREHLMNDTSDNMTLRQLGEQFQQPNTALAITKMVFPKPPIPVGDSAVTHLHSRLEAFNAGDLELAYGRPPSETASDPSTMKANRRPFDPDDSAEAGLHMPTSESFPVKVFTLIAMLTMVAYVVVRMIDVVQNIHVKERDGARTFYRIVVCLIELWYGLSSCSSLVSRTRRQRLEAMSKSNTDTPFQVDDVITLLHVSDENEATIEESVRSHYNASKPDLPFRVVLVADSSGGPAQQVAQKLSREYSTLLHFVKEDLARQEYVMNVANEELQAALNVVLEENMYNGQILFYCLDRLFLQYGHTISNASIVYMPASSVVDSENYYSWSLSYLQQPGFSCVSTPTRARNQPAATDFLDVSNYTRENVYLTSMGGENKFAINSTCFMARGYSLWRVLRRLEMENVDTQYLGWMTYVMHIEARQATMCAMSSHAPITSVLAPTHSPTILSDVLERQAEGFDVALIFDRERPFLSWNLQNPSRSPHDAARTAVFFEATIVVVMLVTLLSDIAPWSTTGFLVPGAFLIHYGLMMILHLATPYVALAPGMAASVMRNRVLAPAHAWLYFLNLSRFGVDRRGHFRAVGETTTADLVTYKQKQREAKEEMKAKQESKAKEQKEKAATDAAEKKTKAQQEAQMKKDAIARKKEEDAAARADAKAAAKAAKEKEKLRRARRGPGMAIVESHAIRTASEECSFSLDESTHVDMSTSHGHTPVANVLESPVQRTGIRSRAAGPVSEGFFSKGEKSQANLDDPASSSQATSVSAANAQKKPTTAPRRDQRNLLPKVQQKKIEIPKFSVPKASSYGRSGTGDRHRRHRFIKAVSIPLAILIILVSAVIVLMTFMKTLGPQAPLNHTMIEVLAARSWTVSCALLGLYILIASFIYLSFIGRFSALVTNSFCAVIFMALSALLILMVGALPFLSSIILSSRNEAFDIEKFHTANIQFYAALGAGNPYTPAAPGWRSPSDTGLVNPANQQSLAGGWYTGPGLSKFTYPQALMLIDMSFVAVTFYTELASMKSAAPGARSAADDVKEILLHGANYLINCHDPATESIVAMVYNPEAMTADAGAQWVAPESRQTGATIRSVDIQNPGTETFASVTAAFGALSIALEIFGETSIVSELRKRANATWTLMEKAQVQSYEKTFPDVPVGSFWPSSDDLEDDKLLAAALMLYSATEEGSEGTFRNEVNAYYTLAQQKRAARVRQGDTGLGALEDFRMGVDDHWWTANLLLFRADSLNSRYAQNIQRFISGWRGSYEYEQNIDSSLIKEVNSLRISTPPEWAQNKVPGFTTPGPVPMTVRAMSYMILYTASQLEESQEDRDVSCFAKGQLRNVLGLNPDSRSFFSGMALDNAASPQQPIIRPGAGPPNFGDSGRNPVVLEGALVNGVDEKGGYRDSRQMPQHSGIGILNNSPMTMLLAGLRSRQLDVEDCIGFKPRDERKSSAVPNQDQASPVVAAEAAGQQNTTSSATPQQAAGSGGTTITPSPVTTASTSA